MTCESHVFAHVVFVVSGPSTVPQFRLDIQFYLTYNNPQHDNKRSGLCHGNALQQRSASLDFLSTYPPKKSALNGWNKLDGVANPLVRIATVRTLFHRHKGSGSRTGTGTAGDILP